MVINAVMDKTLNMLLILKRTYTRVPDVAKRGITFLAALSTQKEDCCCPVYRRIHHMSEQRALMMALLGVSSSSL